MAANLIDALLGDAEQDVANEVLALVPGGPFIEAQGNNVDGLADQCLGSLQALIHLTNNFQQVRDFWVALRYGLDNAVRRQCEQRFFEMGGDWAPLAARLVPLYAPAVRDPGSQGPGSVTKGSVGQPTSTVSVVRRSGRKSSDGKLQ